MTIKLLFFGYMWICFHVLLNKFAINIARLSLYCVSVTASEVNFISFTCYHSVDIFKVYMRY